MSAHKYKSHKKICFFSAGLLCFAFSYAQISDTEKPGSLKIKKTLGSNYSQVGKAFRDSKGNLWFGTLGEGVFRYDGKNFRQFSAKDGLNDNNVNDISQDNQGNILLATGKGINILNGESVSKYFQTDSLNKLSVSCLLEDTKGRLWFACMGKGVYCYDNKTIRIHLSGNDHKFNLGNRYQLILDILEDKKGQIWFSSWNGGGAWKYDGKTFVNYIPSKKYYQANEDQRTLDAKPTPASFNTLMPSLTNDSIGDDMIFSIAEDREGNVWFATRNHGACRFDGKHFKSYREPEGFISYGIYAILQDSKGRFWFGTQRNGVWLYDGKTFRNFTMREGLVDNSVWTIVEDKSGNIWFGTRNFGLSRYNGLNFETFSQ